jgi:hypothetical protein
MMSAPATCGALALTLGCPNCPLNERSAIANFKVYLIARPFACNTLALHFSSKITWSGKRNGETNTQKESGIPSSLHLVWREDSGKRKRRFVWHVPQVFLHNVGDEAADAKARHGW